MLQVDCSSADEFLNELAPRSARFYDLTASSFIFRGHADARYALRPAAFRLGTEMLTRYGWRCRSSDWTNQQQAEAELETIRAFFEQADWVGLELPEDSQLLRETLFDHDLNVGAWPPLSLLSLFGLAQHYGLPTRLLDWSRSSYKAAYFAAREAARWQCGIVPGPTDATRLSVWAYSLLAKVVDNAMTDVFAHDRRVRVVTAPSAANPNLHAQGGLFTLYVPEAINGNTLVDDRALNEIVEESRSSQLMLHVTLPIEEAPVVLRLLAKEGISGATLFPGFAGVTMALNERRCWRRRHS